MKLPKNCKLENASGTDAKLGNITEPWLDVANQVLVSTDGRIMAVVPVEIEEGDVSGHVSREALTAARKLAGKRGDVAIQASSSLALDNGTSFPRPELGGLPNWKKVVPERQEKPAIRICFDVKLLAALCEAMGTERVILEAEDNLTAIRVTPATSSNRVSERLDVESPQAFGVLMPLRLD